VILKQLLEEVNIENVETALENLYFHQDKFNRQVYQDLFEQLKTVSVISSEQNMTLHVEFIEDFGSNDYIWSATYSLYRRYKRKYSLEFATIEQIANASIQAEDVKNKEEYVAHILREYLYNQDSEEEESKFQAEEKKRRQMKKTEYCSIEDVLNSMDEEDIFDD
jgi:hypothetical protein